MYSIEYDSRRAENSSSSPLVVGSPEEDEAEIDAILPVNENDEDDFVDAVENDE